LVEVAQTDSLAPDPESKPQEKVPVVALYSKVWFSAEQSARPFWKKVLVWSLVVDAETTARPPWMVEVAVVEERVMYGAVMRPAAKVKDASSVTPPALSKRMRPALYAPMVSLRPRKVLFPSPRLEVAVKRYPPAPSPMRSWFALGAVEVPVPPLLMARTPVMVSTWIPSVVVEVVAHPAPFQYKSSPTADPETCGIEDEEEMYCAAAEVARAVVKNCCAPSVRLSVLILRDDVARSVHAEPFQYKRSPNATEVVDTSVRSFKVRRFCAKYVAEVVENELAR
jgi:hypothetical protein